LREAVTGHVPGSRTNPHATFAKHGFLWQERGGCDHGVVLALVGEWQDLSLSRKIRHVVKIQFANCGRIIVQVKDATLALNMGFHF
jgi:hypothetical protein